MEYLFACLIGGIIWIILFIIRADLRKEMIFMSLVASPLAIFDTLFVPNYWLPKTIFSIPIGIEGFIYSFELGGTCAVIFAEFFNKVPVKIKKYHKPLSIIVLILILPILWLSNYLELPNLMIGLYLALVTGIAITFLLRKDLIISAILGGIIFGGLYFISLFIWISLFPQVKYWFIFDNLPKIFLLNVPLYESIFGFLFAAYWGSLFELIFGYKYVFKKK